MSAANMFVPVFDALQRMHEHLKGVSELLLQIRSGVIKLDIGSLHQNSELLAKELAKTASFNEGIKNVLGNEEEGVNRLDLLAASLVKAEQEKLNTIRNSIRKLAASIANDIEINRAVLQDSLQFAANSMTVFSNALKQSPTAIYGSQGRFVDAVEAPHIICKEI